MSAWLRDEDGERVSGPCTCCPDRAGHVFGVREDLRCWTCFMPWAAHRANPRPCPAPKGRRGEGVSR